MLHFLFALSEFAKRTEANFHKTLNHKNYILPSHVHSTNVVITKNRLSRIKLRCVLCNLNPEKWFLNAACLS